MKGSRFGDPLKDDAIDYGPLVNELGLDKVAGLVTRVVEAAGRPAFDPGKRVLLRADGPGALPAKHGNRAEGNLWPGGPVVTSEDLDQAIEYANDSDYGLTSSIYTNNLNVAMRASKEMQFGETYINRENFEAMQGYHAGWRKSGIGGADGKHGLMEFTQTRVVYLQYDANAK